MSTRKDDSAKEQNREHPKEPQIIPGDRPGRLDRAINDGLYGDVRKGQKPGKLDD